jgi:hypothetical protein
MSLLQSKRDRALDQLQKAAHEGDLVALAKAEEALVEALKKMHPKEERTEERAPVRRESPAPSAWEQLGGLVLAALAVAFMVFMFLALCAGPDHW